MISKELLSVVLCSDCTKVDKLLGNTLGFCVANADVGRINIYELAHKCKEWAWAKGIDLQIMNHGEAKFCCKIDERNVKYHSAKWGETEPEAIFKACQWILENKAKD